MNNDQFDAYVSKLDTIAKRNSRLFLIRVLVLAFVGYIMLFMFLVGGIASLLLGIVAIFYFPAAAKIWIFMIVVGAVLAWSIARGMWVRLRAPAGLRLTPGEHPRLFSMISDLADKAGCQPFDVVVLDGNYNAAVVQLPRLGIFGWHKNYLMIGLPIMQSLTTEEFRAALAHEFAHLSGKHGIFSNWIYRTRLTWERTIFFMSQRGHGAVLMWFLKWYWPKFNGHAFVLSRANEFEADAFAGEVASKSIMSHALTRIRMDSQRLDEVFWKDVFLRANKQTTPPQQVFTELRQYLSQSSELTKTNRWLEVACNIPTDNTDTHPCLLDRIRALGATIDTSLPTRGLTIPPPAVPSAAEDFFDTKLQSIEDELSQQWAIELEKSWLERLEESQKLQQQLAEVPPDSEDADKLWRRIEAMMALEGTEVALPDLERMVAVHPNHAPANLVLGAHFLSKDDETGLDYLSRASEEDESLKSTVFGILAEYALRNGRHEDYKEFIRQIEGRESLEAAAVRERQGITARDNLLPHCLTSNEIENLNEVFRNEKRVRAVFVARKAVQHFQKVHYHVILVVSKDPWYLPSSSYHQRLLKRLLANLQLESSYFLMVEDSSSKKIAKRVRKVPDALVYSNVEAKNPKK